MSVSGISFNTTPYVQTTSASTVSVATALATIGATRSGMVTIQDTADNIARNLDALQAARSRISAITIDGTDPLKISAKQVQSAAGALAKISSYTLAIDNALAADVKRLAANTKVTSITVRDSAVNLGTQLNALQTHQNKVSDIWQTGLIRPIEIQSAQLTSAADALGKIRSSYTLNVRGVSVADLAAVAANDAVKGIGVLDTSDAIANNLDTLQSYGIKLLSAQSTDKAPLSVTASQISSDALVLGKIYGGYQLNVRGASLAELAALSNNSKIKTIDVRDTAENVARNLEALKKLGKSLTSIEIVDPQNALAITGKEFAGYAAVLEKISTSNVSYAVSSASIARLSSLADHERVASIAVSDSAKNIVAGFEALSALGDKLTGIERVGTTTALTITAAQLEDRADVIAKIRNPFSLSVNTVLAENAVTLARLESVSAIRIADASDNLAAQWNAMSDSTVLAKIRQITQTGTPSALTLTAAQIAAGKELRSKFIDAYSLIATSVSASSAAALAADANVTSLSVEDSSAQIAQHLDALHGIGSKLTTIAQSGTAEALSITATQLRDKRSTIDKIANDYTLAVRQVFASEAAATADTANVSSVAISDAASNVSANLDTLTGLGAKLSAIHVLGKPATISLTASQLSSASATLGKISSNYTLAVTDVAAADAATVAATDRVVSVSVSDSSANIAAQLDTLSQLGKELRQIVQSSVTAMHISAATLLKHTGVLEKIADAYTLKVSDVSVRQADTIAAIRNVTGMSIVDGSEQIARNLDPLIALNPLIESLSQSGTPTALKLTTTQKMAGASLLSKLDGGDYTLTITNARADQVQALAADTKVSRIEVTDTATNLVSYLADLKAAMAVDVDGTTVDKLGTLTQSGNASLVMTASQLADHRSVMNKFSRAYQLDIREALAADAATLAQSKSIVALRVADSSAAIATHLDSLHGLGKKLKAITQTGTTSALALTATQMLSGGSTLAKITNRYTLAVRDVTAENATRVAAWTQVASMAITDTSARIAARIDALQKVVPKIGSITQLADSKAVLSITAAQRVSASDVLSRLDSYTLNLRQVSAASASALTNDALVAAFDVVDTSANIASHFDALTAAGDKLTTLRQSGTAAPLALTLAQHTAGTGTLAKLANNYNLALREVAVSEAATAAALARVVTVDVADSSANIAAGIGTLGSLRAKLGSITQTGTAAALEITQAQYDAGRLALAKMSNAYTLNITQATAARADELARLAQLERVSFSDTSAHVSEYFDDLIGLGTRLNSVSLSSVSEAIEITRDQLRSGVNALGKVSGDYQLTISGASAEEAASVAAQANVTRVRVRDTSANLATHLNALVAMGDELAGMALTDNLTPMALTYSQWTAAAATLGKISNGYRATVSGVGAADAASLSTNKSISRMQVTDSATAIVEHMATLSSLGKKLGAVQLSGDTMLDLTLTQLQQHKGVLAKIVNDYGLIVRNASAAAVDAVAARSDVREIYVRDTAQNLATYWNNLSENGAQIGGVVLTNSAAIGISADQLAQHAALIPKISGDFSLAITDVRAEQAVATAALEHVGSVSVADTAENLSAHFTALSSLGSKLQALSVSDQGRLQITAGQLQNNATTLAKISNDYSLAVTGVGAADATAVGAMSRVASLAVEDSSASIATQLTALQALGSKLSGITQSGEKTTMAITAAQMLANADALSKISDSYSLAVSEVSAAEASIVAGLASVASVAVTDTGAAIATSLDALHALGSALTGITQSDSSTPVTVTSDELAANATTLAKLGTYSLNVTGVTMVSLADVAARSEVTGITIEDNSAHISSSFDALAALGDRLLAVRQSGTVDALALSAAQYGAGSSVLGKMDNDYTLSLSGVSADGVAALASDVLITGIAISDTGANIAAKLDDLTALGSRLTAVQQTDTDALTIAASAWISAGAVWPKFVGTLSVAITGASAADAGALGAQAGIDSIAVSDSRANLNTHWNALNGLGSTLQSITLTGDEAPVTLTASQLFESSALLGKISGNLSLTITEVGVNDAAAVAATSNVTSLKVADTAAHLQSSLAALDTLGAALTEISVTDSTTLTVTQAQNDSYTTLLGKLASGMTLSIET